MAILFNLDHIDTGLDIAGLTTGFGIRVECFDLERNKPCSPCLLLEDSAIASPANPLHCNGYQQPTNTSKRS